MGPRGQCCCSDGVLVEDVEEDVEDVEEDVEDVDEDVDVDEDDVLDWRNTIRVTRNVLGQEALAPYRGEEIQPGFDVGSDDAIDEWVKQNAESAYHPTSTCRMGSENDPMAVIDPECRVIGLQNLRVVDSSIFPSIPNGNLNAPTMMVAERAADIILASRTQ